MKDPVMRLWGRLRLRWHRARPLALDFAQAQAQSRAKGVVAVAALLLSLALWQSDKAQERVSRLEAELNSLGVKNDAGRIRSAPVAATGVELEDRIRKANRVIRQLSTPWEDVFGGMESANGQHIALLSMESDPGNAEVRVAAEARNVPKMLEYLERLRQDGRLSPAILQSHQLMIEDPSRPVRFTFTASWTSVKKAPK
jgi:hypothetical protein